MPDCGPRDGQVGQVGAVFKRVEDHTVRLGSVETVEPHALDLRGQRWEVVEVPYGLLQGSEGVAVNSSARGTINELVQGVA